MNMEQEEEEEKKVEANDSEASLQIKKDEPEEEDEDSDYIDENFEMDETDEFWGINRHRCGDFIQNTNDIKNMDQKNIPLRHRESKKQLYQYVNK
jgi:hypothetical protein